MKIERYLQPFDLNFNYLEGNFLSNSFSLKPKLNYIKRSKLYENNGKRETDRRKWQIAHGQLKLDNGLIYEPSSGSV